MATDRGEKEEETRIDTNDNCNNALLILKQHIPIGLLANLARDNGGWHGNGM